MLDKDEEQAALWRELEAATGSSLLAVVVGRRGRAARISALRRAITEARRPTP